MKLKKKQPKTAGLLVLLTFLISSCNVSLPSTMPADTAPADEIPAAEIPAEEVKEDEEETISIPSKEDEAAPVASKEAGEPEEPEETEEAEPEEPSFEGYILGENDVSENGVYLKSVKEEGKVKIVFAGDINFDDRYANMNTLRSRGQGIFGCIGESLIERSNDADIFMINNEFPYSSRGTPLAGKKFTFRAKPETVQLMKDLGADIVSLANNHAYDHGPEALLDTFDTLDEAGIPYVGAGHNLEEAMKPVYFIAGGMKTAFVSATQIERSLPPDTKEATETEPGVLRTLDPTKFLEVIKEAKENSDFVIAYVHWGSENTNIYEAAQTELAKAYADAGADLIIGDHPHVLQGITYIGETPVFYSLGNYWFSSKTLDSCLIEVILTEGRIESLQFIPCLQKGCSTVELVKGSGEYERVLNNLRSWSTDNVEIDEDGRILRSDS